MLHGWSLIHTAHHVNLVQGDNDRDPPPHGSHASVHSVLRDPESAARTVFSRVRQVGVAPLLACGGMGCSQVHALGGGGGGEVEEVPL